MTAADAPLLAFLSTNSSDVHTTRWTDKSVRLTHFHAAPLVSNCDKHTIYISAVHQVHCDLFCLGEHSVENVDWEGKKLI